MCNFKCYINGELMTISKENYVSLITSQYQNSPKFLEWLSCLFQPIQDIAWIAETMDNAFDLDLAVGLQLDVVGREAGISRRLKIAIPVTDIAFTWDDANLGWDFGEWVDPDSSTILDLSDDAYRQIIKLKIAANIWDGSIDKIYEAWENLFGSDSILAIKNNLDMTMDVFIVGESTMLTTAYLLLADYVSFRPAGVDANYYINSTGYPYFCWDSEIDGLFGGWDEGVWAMEGFQVNS